MSSLKLILRTMGNHVVVFILIKTVDCDLARLHLLHKTCWVDSTLGSPDWTVRLNAYTVHAVPAWIM